MNSILIIIAISVVVISAYFQRKNSAPDVIGESISITPTTTMSPSPTATITLTPSPTSAPTQSATQSSIDFYVYPGSNIINKSSSSLALQSSDSPDTITNWYKEKIKAEGMNAKSFVLAKTNGSIHNELVGVGNEKKISVTIKKNSDQSTVRIDVSL